ncbi:MAG: hypothetical protein FJ202_00035 [Gemmatimonadetes bacterium]|nr:hypothetical protein [Gemmatimonadota bacterium]
MLLTACGGDATGPTANLFRNVVAIGGDLTAGVRDDGLTLESQRESWAAVLAQAAGASFGNPLYRSPGCAAPVVAPLGLGRRASGALATAADSACTGAAASFTLPTNNLAIPGATAWAVRNATPRSVTQANSAYSALDRARYPHVLPATQSQVTAALIAQPTLVALELGSAEVLAAIREGRVSLATALPSAPSATAVPAALFAAELAMIADSLDRTGARVMATTVPHFTKAPAFRTGNALWAVRASLAPFGITVAADCNGSANLVNVAALVAPLVAPPPVPAAGSAGPSASVSCSDRPGTADRVLTPGDVTQLDAIVDAMNAELRRVTTARHWVLVDLDALYSTLSSGAGAVVSSALLTCARPFGHWISLDGILPSGPGHVRIAAAAAAALNQAAGTAVPVADPALALTAAACASTP